MRIALLVGAAILFSACNKSSNAALPLCTPSQPSNGVAQVCSDEKGFRPPHIDVKKGDKLRVLFTRTTDKTCGTEIVSEELGINKPLPLNVPVEVEIPTGEARNITFACGMKMMQTVIVVKPL